MATITESNTYIREWGQKEIKVKHEVTYQSTADYVTIEIDLEVGGKERICIPLIEWQLLKDSVNRCLAKKGIRL